MAVALLVAAGRGERLGADGPKAFVVLAGRPMLEWSLDALRAVEAVTRIVVALPPGVEAPPGTVGVSGGAERSHSVRAALPAAGEGPPDRAGDRARRGTPARHAGAVRARAGGAGRTRVRRGRGRRARRRTRSSAPPATDLRVTETLDRSALWAVQTPQVFRRDALARALAQPDEALALATDDAGLVEQAGGRVHVVESPADNLKVTTPIDLRLAEILLERLHQC